MANSIPYTAWLHWSLTNACNLNCKYCFGYDHHAGFVPSEIDISAVINTLEQTGQIFRIGFTGNGEPFLIPNFIDLCTAIADKHYLTINTNLTSIKIKDFAQIEGLSAKVLKIFASVHFAELTRLNLWDRFLENYGILVSSGFKIDLTAVAWPGYIGKIEKDLEALKKISGKVNFEPFFGVWQDKKYPISYSDDELAYFGLTKSDCDKFYQKNTLCNAGYNAAVVTPSGKITACFQETEKLGSIYTGFRFNIELLTCRHKICGCPLKVYDGLLFDELSKYFMIQTKKAR